MKYIRTISRTTLVAAFISVGASYTSAQSPDGFEGIPWGTSLDWLEKQFELLPHSTGGEFHSYASNVLHVGPAEVSECDFEFVKGKFAGVAILTRGTRNTHRLLSHLRKLFGEGHQEDPRTYQWFSGQTHVSFDEDSDGDGYVYWYSRTLLRGPE